MGTTSYSTDGSHRLVISYFYYTRGIMKCPKKHVKEDFIMWWHFLNFLKCPKIEEFHFRFIYSFKIDHVLIFWNAPLFYVRIFWNAPFFSFSESDRKWTENEILRFLGISKNWENVITWQNPLSHAFWGISWYLVYMKMNDVIRLRYWMIFWVQAWYESIPFF